MTALHSRGSALSNANSTLFALQLQHGTSYLSSSSSNDDDADDAASFICGAASRATLDNRHPTDRTSAAAGRWMEDEDSRRIIVGIVCKGTLAPHDLM
jgi:hypothetical protein